MTRQAILLSKTKLTFSVLLIIFYSSTLLAQTGAEERRTENVVTDTIEDPWGSIDLTGERMKPFYIIPPPAKPSFLIPLLTAAISAGVLTFVLAHDDKDLPPDCNFTISPQVIDANCGLANGSILLNVTPVTTYNFLWSNGQTSSQLINVPAGNYAVTVTQSGTTCQRTSTVTINDIPVLLDAEIQIQSADCGQSNGSITINITPEGTYAYIWSNGSTSQNQSGLVAGNYEVTVSAGGNCERTFPVQVEENAFTPQIDFNTTSADCGIANGMIGITIDPPASYNYNWSNGSTESQITNLAAGNYMVTVSIPGTNCSSTGEVELEELPPEFEVTINTTPAECGQSNGTGNINVNPQGQYDYQWSNGNTGSTATGLSPGEYRITVSITGTQCSKEIIATVDSLPPAFQLSVTTTPADCGQSNGTGNINVNPPGKYDYHWSNGSTGAQVSGLPFGGYNITVSIPGTNCAKTIMAEIEELPPPFDLSINTSPADCGQSNGTGNININPPGNYFITWSNGSTSDSVSNLNAGSHTVTVTLPGTNCSKTIGTIVEENPANFIISSTTTPSGCETPSGSVSVIVVPEGNYTYTWSNGMIGPTINGIAAGQYSVTVTLTGTSCSLVHEVSVGQSGVGFTATFNSQPANCGVSNGAATIIVDPPGEYMYLWSNGLTGDNVSSVSAGNYIVTVTDTQGCSASFETTVVELPAEYITIGNVTPATCIGGGEIFFTISTPGVGPLLVGIEGPPNTFIISMELAPGTFQLSAFESVTPGNYIFSVSDIGIGTSCIETTIVGVQDITPVLITTDDFYQTITNMAVSGNVLENDAGLMIVMTGTSQAMGGTVSFNSNGTFTFIPINGFNGEASFVYTAMDVCGTQSSATVTIIVDEVICDFSVEETITPASCSLDDGAISIDVIEPGDYEYIWNNGDSGPTISNLFAGTYIVTIEDVTHGCSLIFTFNVPESPADYVEDFLVTQPTCSSPGDISFTATNAGAGQLLMVIQHPNGANSFFIDEGDIALSDFIDITPGDYSIEVLLDGAGPECIQSFEATIQIAPALVIQLADVIPPSEPTAMDGAIIIQISDPGSPPYTMLLDDVFFGMTTETLVVFEGVSAGVHDVQLIDADGCESNILQVFVPFPDIIMSFGAILGTGNLFASFPEHTLAYHEVFSMGAFMTLEYIFLERKQTLRLARFRLDQKIELNANAVTEATFLSEIVSTQLKGIHFSVAAGFGFRHVNISGSAHAASGSSSYFLVRSNAKKRIGKYHELLTAINLEYSGKKVFPNLEFGFSARLPIKSYHQYHRRSSS